MAEQLPGFGINPQGESLIQLRLADPSSTPVPVNKTTILANPDFQQLINLAQQTKAIGSSAPTNTPGAPVGTVPNNVVQIYSTMSNVQNKLNTTLQAPIQDFSAAVRTTQTLVNNVQTPIFQANQIWQDAGVVAGQVAQTVKNITNLFNPPQKAVYNTNPATNTNYFNRVMMPWTVTTIADRLQLSKTPSDSTYLPVSFFVNPSKVHYSMAHVEASELVQKGQFITTWRDPSNQNKFPVLKLNFTFQTSNIMAERYATTTLQPSAKTETIPDPYLVNGNSSSFSTAPFTQAYDSIANSLGLGSKIPQATTKDISLKTQAIKDIIYNMPPGLKNFFDLIGIINQSRIMDATKIDPPLTPTQVNHYDGQPNYVILRLSTRTFPLLTLYGYFTGNLDFGEDAQDPLKFETELNFIALNSDPPWWDRDQIQDRYNNFYSNWISLSTSKVNVGLEGELTGFAAGINNASSNARNNTNANNVDMVISQFASSNGIAPSALSPAVQMNATYGQSTVTPPPNLTSTTTASVASYFANTPTLGGKTADQLAEVVPPPSPNPGSMSAFPMGSGQPYGGNEAMGVPTIPTPGTPSLSSYAPASSPYGSNYTPALPAGTILQSGGGLGA